MVSIVFATVVMLQGLPHALQSPVIALIGAVALVLAATIGVFGSHWAQSKRFERAEADIAAHVKRLETIGSDVSALGQRLERFETRILEAERRMARLDADFASFATQTQRVERLESDLIALLSRTDITRVVRALIDAVTDRLLYEPVRTVTLATFLRRVDEDPMMRQMADIIIDMRAHNLNGDDVKRFYEGLKRQLPGSTEGEH